MTKLLITSLFLILISSCQKEISSPTGSAPIPIITNDSILISKIIGLDTTKTAPLDTVYKLLFQYDNLKRISSSLTIDYNNTGIAVDTFCNNKYFYNGTDTLPFKVNAIIDDLHTYLDTDYYQYSSPERRVIYDSSIQYDANPIYTYFTFQSYDFTYFTNQVSQTERDYPNGVYGSTQLFKIPVNKISGNIVSQRDTTSGGDVEVFNSTYDNKLNPLNRFNFGAPIIHFGSDFFTTDYLLIDQVNNITEINEVRTIFITGNIYLDHYKFLYSYNTTGYPTEARILNIGSTSPRSFNKLKYFYTN